MIDFINFRWNDSKIIIDALEFTQETILEYYKKLISKIKPKLQETAWEEYNKIVRPIYDSRDFTVQTQDKHFLSLTEEFFKPHMNRITSSLIVYRRYSEETLENTGINSYSKLIKNR
jgi:hypothetical protein